MRRKTFNMTTEREPELRECPLCNGPATFQRVPYTGVLSSGMEFPDWAVGCPACGLWLEKARGSAWIESKGTLNLELEAKEELAAKWNVRATDRQIAELRAALEAARDALGHFDESLANALITKALAAK